MESQLPEPSSIPVVQRKPPFLIATILILIFVLIAVFFYYLQIKKTNPLTNNQPSTTVKTKLLFASNLISPVQVKDTQTEVFSCPTRSSFCNDNQNFKDQFMSDNLPANTLLFASFDGDLISLISYQTTENIQEQFTTLILTNKEKGLIAHYRFKGSGADNKAVQAGDSIGTTNGQKLPFYNSSFAFEVNRITSEKSEVIILKKESFKQ